MRTSKDLDVITKLIKDTREGRIIWTWHALPILHDAPDKVSHLANKIWLDGVYTTEFHGRTFQFTQTSENICNYILEISDSNNFYIAKRFPDSSALLSLAQAIEEQQTGLDSFFDEYLKS